MAGRSLDLAKWPRAGRFRFFRPFQRPHFATTSRVDVRGVIAAKGARGVSPFRAALHAIGEGLHAVPELRTRFRGETVMVYDRLVDGRQVGDFFAAALERFRIAAARCLADAMPTVSTPAPPCRTGPRWLPSS